MLIVGFGGGSQSTLRRKPDLILPRQEELRQYILSFITLPDEQKAEIRARQEEARVRAGETREERLERDRREEGPYGTPYGW